MNERELLIAVARSLYWGYAKDTTGTPGKWSELKEDERKIWLSSARRAVRKIDETRAGGQLDGPAQKRPDGA